MHGGDAGVKNTSVFTHASSSAPVSSGVHTHTRPSAVPLVGRLGGQRVAECAARKAASVRSENTRFVFHR